MEKYISFTVPSDSAISTVGQVLRAQGHLTKKQISRAKFLPDGIQKNGIRCRITESVLPGDEIQVCLETAETASEQLVSGDFSSLEILYEDQDILAVNKPAGMLHTSVRSTLCGHTFQSDSCLFSRSAVR